MQYIGIESTVCWCIQGSLLFRRKWRWFLSVDDIVNQITYIHESFSVPLLSNKHPTHPLSNRYHVFTLTSPLLIIYQISVKRFIHGVYIDLYERTV